MATNYNPRIVTDGLVLALDAGNTKSYNAGISTTAWNDLSGNGNDGTLVNGVVSTFQVGDGTWHHIVGSNDTVTSKLYIDGVLNNSVSQVGLATVQSNISIGYWQSAATRYLNGNIAQVSIYNRALTASEIQQNFNALRGRFGI